MFLFDLVMEKEPPKLMSNLTLKLLSNQQFQMGLFDLPAVWIQLLLLLPSLREKSTAAASLKLCHRLKRFPQLTGWNQQQRKTALQKHQRRGRIHSKGREELLIKEKLSRLVVVGLAILTGKIVLTTTLTNVGRIFSSDGLFLNP